MQTYIPPYIPPIYTYKKNKLWKIKRILFRTEGVLVVGKGHA